MIWTGHSRESPPILTNNASNTEQKPVITQIGLSTRHSTHHSTNVDVPTKAVPNTNQKKGFLKEICNIMEEVVNPLKNEVYLLTINVGLSFAK